MNCAITRTTLTQMIAGMSIMLSLLNGCSSTPTMGERVQGFSADTAKLAERWTEGESMIREGEKLIAEGNEITTEGEKLIRKGNNRISAGKDDVKRGEKLVSLGRRQVAEAEAEFAVKHPDHYQNLLHKN